MHYTLVRRIFLFNFETRQATAVLIWRRIVFELERKKKHNTVHCLVSNTHTINSLSGSLTTEQTNVILDLYSQNTPQLMAPENALVLARQQ